LNRRDVALKGLSAAARADLDWLARFEREAKVLASLNHANIGSMARALTVSASRASRGTGPNPPRAGTATRVGTRSCPAGPSVDLGCRHGTPRLTHSRASARARPVLTGCVSRHLTPLHCPPCSPAVGSCSTATSSWSEKAD